MVLFLHGSSGLGLKAIAEWQQWLAERSGKLKKAPAALGSKAFAPGEASPGTYVHER